MMHADLTAAVKASLDHEAHRDVYPVHRPVGVVIDPRPVSKKLAWPRTWK